ncbi:MAG: VWA domain-containing protein, partial [Methanophagales archaeon]|nr:VWA domain-containing protein [Methanophagales archaeon]
IFSEYTIPVSPIKDTDFTFHLIGGNPEWLEINSISGNIELTLPDGITGESEKTVQIDSGEIEDIVFSLHANEIGKQTITVTAEIMGYSYPQYVDINIIDENDEFIPLDLCMVLDRSGSMDNPMGDEKKIQGAKEAATDVVDVLMPQDRVSLISFSSTATTDIDFTSDFNAVKTKIDQVSANGGTSFGAGLQAALDQFNANGNPDHVPAILFMSDGMHQDLPDPDAFIVECKDKEIPIFTVGFAASESGVDVTKLKNMADETGGEYLFADDIFKLQNIFIELQHKASGWESEATYTGEVNQGQTVTAGSFDIAPSTKNSRVTLNWPGSDLDLKLLNPDGIPINLSAPDITYSGDTKPEYVILKEPQPGTWTVRVYGKVVDFSEDYYVLVTEYVPPGSQICKTQITSDPSLQDRPSIVNANGDYYVAYQSWETGSSYNGDIFIKKYDSKWNEVKKEQITDNPYYQDSPSLVFANNELYVALITNH